jgi:hypothetical protein
MTAEVIGASADLVLNNLEHQKALINDRVFQDAIAKVLVSNHRLDLRGPAGVDADNVVIAKLLMSDPDFLSRVSVSAILRTNNSGTVGGK